MADNGIRLLLSLFAFFFIALWGWWVYRFLRYRSKLGAELGAVVKAQVGESTAKAYEWHPATLRVYQVTRPQTGSDLVGLEIRIPTASSDQRTSLTFTLAEARDLVDLMEKALAVPEAANKQCSRRGEPLSHSRYVVTPRGSLLSFASLLAAV